MSTSKNRLSCKSARLYYYDLIDAEKAESVPKEVHEHVASCADCQSDMNRLRDLLASAGKKHNSEQSRRDKAVVELLSLHFAWAGRPVGCTEAKPFLPSLADPLLQISRQTPITAHVDNCKACSEELSALRESGLSHKQLCRISRIIAEDSEADADSPELRAVMPMVTGMMERPDSGITTLFTLGEPNGEAAQAGKDASYASRPIEVEVIGANESSKREQKASVLKLKQYLKPALAAAAVILIGFAMFFRAPAVKAVSGPGQIYIAIKGADNIYVSEFTPDDPKPVQEQWVSHSRSIYMTRTGQEMVLWDVTRGIRKRKETANSITEVETVTENRSAEIRQIINGTLGIMPGNDVSELPPGHKWIEVDDIDLEPEFQDCKVYDLTWSEINNGGDSVSWKWRLFIETDSCRPKKVESSLMSPTDEKYIPLKDTVINYLDEDEIKTAIEQASL